MKKTLTYVIGALILSGLVFMIFVFAASMQPSARAKSERSQHNITTLEPGYYRIEPFSRGSAWNEVVLLIRDWDAKYYVYLVSGTN